jgi:hypothetical protein
MFGCVGKLLFKPLMLLLNSNEFIALGGLNEQNSLYFATPAAIAATLALSPGGSFAGKDH